MVDAQIGTTVPNLPVTYNVYKQTIANAGNATANDIQNQVLFTPTSSFTDFFMVWGLWLNSPNSNVQLSAVSPLVIQLSIDFGDAPNSYKTYMSSGGASHGAINTLKLGNTINLDSDGAPSTNANISTDDDGITTVPIISNSGSTSQVIPSYSVNVAFNNTTGLAANYGAWLDWNNNGIFDANEGIITSTAASSTSGTITLTWTNMTLSGSVGLSNTYLRLRMTTDVMTSANATGAFSNGEVEDYKINFATAFPVELVKFDGEIQDGKAFIYWNTASEFKIKKYEIEYSKNGKTFEPIMDMSPKNGIENKYEYTTSFELAKDNYFRLAIIEDDGSVSYSKQIVLFDDSKKFKYTLAPNPVEREFNVISSNLNSFDLTIFNELGEIVEYSTSLYPNSSVNTSKLSKGLYLARIEDEYGNIESIKFLKL
jgi:hypothetical protein